MQTCVQLCGAQAMTHAHNRLWHQIAKMIDHMDQVAAVVVPGSLFFCVSTARHRSTGLLLGSPTVVSKIVLVDDPAGALVGCICDPD